MVLTSCTVPLFHLRLKLLFIFGKEHFRVSERLIDLLNLLLDDLEGRSLFPKANLLDVRLGKLSCDINCV